MKYKYLIVDDEPLARKLMQSHASKVEILTEVGVCADAIAAANILRTTPVDLLFLDIQMPELTGLAFIKSLKQPPAIIVTTAYREFAAEAFDLDVLDYLVKPISFERFLKSIDKFTGRLQVVPNTVKSEVVVSIKADRKIFPVAASSIVYIESLDNYVKVHMEDQTLITRENITSLEEKLGQEFVRIHRSFLVSRKHVKSFSAEGVQIHNRDLPFGRAYKLSAMQLLQLR